MKGVGPCCLRLDNEKKIMKNGFITRTISFFGAAVFVSSLFVGSLIISCSSAGMSCDFDSNCNGGELCVEGICANPCTSDLQCDDNRTCQVFIRENEADQVHVCMLPPTDDDNNAVSPQCSGDEECREILGSVEAICGLNYRCVFPEIDGGQGEAKAFDSVLIHDRTPRAWVDEQNHPGTVVSAVFVRDQGGSIVGYGNTIAFVPGVVDEEQAGGHLDGQPVQLDESGQCVAGDDPAMSALGGEGGYYLVGFVDYRGARIALGQGWKVIVIGWSAQCGGELDFQQESGEYDVSLCVSSGGAVEDFDADCQKSDGKVSGYAEFLVTENG